MRPWMKPKLKPQINPKEALKKPIWTFRAPDMKSWSETLHETGKNPKWNSKETRTLKKP